MLTPRLFVSVHGIEIYYKLLVLWVCRPAGYLYVICLMQRERSNRYCFGLFDRIRR